MITESWFEATIDEFVNDYVDGIDNRLNEIIKNKQTTTAASVKHIHFTYTNKIFNKLLFEEVEEDVNGIYMYWFDELEYDELGLCEEIVKHVEPDKVDEHNSIQIIFNDDKFYLTLFVAHSMNEETTYGFIVKLIDEENCVYDVEELVD